MTLGPWGEVMTVSVLKVPAERIADRSASRRSQRAATPPGEEEEEETEVEVENNRVAIAVVVVVDIVLPLSWASPRMAILRPLRARARIVSELMTRRWVGWMDGQGAFERTSGKQASNRN